MAKFNKKEISINDNVPKKTFSNRAFKCKKCPIEVKHKHVSKMVPIYHQGNVTTHYRRVNTIVMIN